MRVVHVLPSVARAYGGPTSSLIGYVRAALHLGIETMVAAPAPSEADQMWLRAEIAPASIQFFTAVGHGASVLSPALQRWLPAARADVVHCHGLLNFVSTFASRSAIRSGVPLVLRPFGTLSRYTFHHRRTALKRAYFALFESFNLRNAAALHFTTETERDEAAWHGIDFESRAFVVPPPWTRGVTARPRRDRSDNPPVALLLSRLDPIKNIEVLIKAWQSVAQILPEARLVIAGDGKPDYVAILRQLAASLGLSRSIEFAGFVTGEKKAALLSTATIFVLPSKHENFGVAVLEALAAGLPVIVSPEVQLSPMVKKHELGLVAAAEPVALANAMLSAFGDESLHEHCRQFAPRFVETTFAVPVVATALGRMYERAVEANART